MKSDDRHALAKTVMAAVAGRQASEDSKWSQRVRNSCAAVTFTDCLSSSAESGGALLVEEVSGG